MKIILDIMHVPHINFFKNAVVALRQKGVDIKVICLNRGKNVLIAREEFTNIDVISIGRHKGGFFSIIFEANILRYFTIMKHLISNKYDAGMSVGGFLLGFGLKFVSKPNVQFYDDPENKKNLFFQRLTASKLYYPSFYKSKGIINFNALKEWAYLSPKYFNPDPNCLKEYNFKEKGYFFIREVNSNTTNYRNQTSDIILSIANKLPPDAKVIFSLENKDNIKYYPKSWILLKEPVKDIHSILYYSKAIISSGDSMAREGAMLGVPSVYCGVRKMAGNRVMEKKGFLYDLDIDKVPDFMSNISKYQTTISEQKKFRDELLLEWDDVTETIVSSVLYYK